MVIGEDTRDTSQTSFIFLFASDNKEKCRKASLFPKYLTLNAHDLRFMTISFHCRSQSFKNRQKNAFEWIPVVQINRFPSSYNQKEMMNQLSFFERQGHSHLCRKNLKVLAASYLNDQSLQAKLHTKLKDLLGHFNKQFRTRIEDLNFQGLVSINNWRRLALRITQQQIDVTRILKDNLDQKIVINNQQLLNDLDRFFQGVAVFAHASYSLLSSIRSHLYSAYLFKGESLLLELFDKLDPETFLEDFSSKYCEELFQLSKKVTEAREEFEYYASISKDRNLIRAKAVESLILIISNASNSIGNVVKDRRIDGTRLRRLFETILSWLQKNSHLVTTLENRRQHSFAREFLISLDSTFLARVRKIESVNLSHKIGKEDLSQDQIKTIYDIDKITIGSAIANFVTLVVNPSLPDSEQIDVGESPRELWQQLNPRHKCIIQNEISKRIGSLFFDEKTAQKMEDMVPAARLFSEELRRASKLPIFTPEQSPCLNTFGIIEIADDVLGFDSLASLLKALRRVAPNFEKEHPKLRYNRVIFLENFRRGLLITSLDQSPRFFSFASTDSLTGPEWQLIQYTISK